VILGITAIAAPLVVTSITDLLGESWTRLVSCVGAASVALIGGFRLSQKSNQIRRAYLDLRNLVLKYETDASISQVELVAEFTKLTYMVGVVDGPGSKPGKPTGDKPDENRP